MELLEQCPTESNKYAGIGAVIFFTGLFAAIAATYALYTIFDWIVPAIFFGLIWGAMIFNLDRYIVSSMKKEDKIGKELKIAFPRLILAVLIAVVISKPLELKIFEKEIETELITMNESIHAAHLADIEVRYQQEIRKLDAIKVGLEEEIVTARAKRDTLQMIAQKEADGTGGTMQRNAGPIYRIKKEDADRANEELAAIVDHHQPLIDQKIEEINTLILDQKEEMAALPSSNFSGLAARLQALENLGEENQAIYWASLFVMLLFIALESSPVIVKLLADKGPYDELLESDQYPYQLFAEKKMRASETYDMQQLRTTILNRGITTEADVAES